MREPGTQGAPFPALIALTLGLWGGAIALPSEPAAGVEPTVPQPTEASPSLTPIESGRVGEPVPPPFLMTELLRDLPYAVPVPIVGRVGIEVE